MTALMTAAVKLLKNPQGKIPRRQRIQLPITTPIILRPWRDSREKQF